MKIEAKFYSENNSLYFLDGAKADLGSGKIGSFPVKWTEVGLDEDSYNEEFLANLRDQFKAMEDSGTYGFVVPVCDSECVTEVQKESLVASMKHCARRIKDCENIIGFAVPDECDGAFFMEELSAKHKHYVYFSKNENLLKSNDKIVLF